MHSSPSYSYSYVGIDFKFCLILYRLLAHILQCSTLFALEQIQLAQLLLIVSAMLAGPHSLVAIILYALERVQLN